MSQDSSKKHHTHTVRKPPSRYSEDKSLNEVDKKLVEDLDLSETEFARYKKLPPYKKAEIIHLLTERKRLNIYVNNHLQEEINKQFGPLMQFFLPSENDLKYALQKVDEMEKMVNEQVGDELQVFDEVITKKNRLEALLITAHTYLDLIDKKLSKHEHSARKNKQVDGLQKKRDDLAIIIEELHTQLERSEFFIHNKAVLGIRDSELGSFISKIKTIGIDFTPKGTKYQPTFFNISIITTMFGRLIPNDSSQKNNDIDNSDADIVDSDTDSEEESPRAKRPKNR